MMHKGCTGKMYIDKMHTTSWTFDRRMVDVSMSEFGDNRNDLLLKKHSIRTKTGKKLEMTKY